MWNVECGRRNVELAILNLSLVFIDINKLGLLKNMFKIWKYDWSKNPVFPEISKFDNFFNLRSKFKI